MSVMESSIVNVNRAGKNECFFFSNPELQELLTQVGEMVAGVGKGKGKGNCNFE